MQNTSGSVITVCTHSVAHTMSMRAGRIQSLRDSSVLELLGSIRAVGWALTSYCKPGREGWDLYSPSSSLDFPRLHPCMPRPLITVTS